VTRASASRTCSNGNTAPDLGPQLAGIDQAAQLLQPRPVDVGGERFAGDAALELGGSTLQDQEDRPAAVTDRAEGLAAGLAAGAVQQQVHAAGNGGTHLLGPADGVVVEDLAGAQALQVVTVGRAGHARGRAPMAAAICTAALPTPPAAAVVSTVCPGCSRLGETRLAGHGGEAVGRGQRQFSEPATRREQARVHPLARLDAGPVAGRFDDSATS
jgi:hypothetical protein